MHQMKGDLHQLREDVNQFQNSQREQWNQVNENIQNLQGSFEQAKKEQQEEFDWGEVRSALDKVIEQNKWQQRNLAEFRHLYDA
ncbi:hypothetical protein AHAS_Ahas04G0100600 [Arachis hypogaea]